MTLTYSDRSQAQLRDKVSDFVVAELAMLDDRLFEEWMGLFTEEGYYWAPVAQDQKDPFSYVSLFYDTVPTMRTRIGRLRHPRIFMQIPHSRTVHMASNFQVTAHNEEEVVARCNFTLLEYRPSRPQNVWGGRYDYVLAIKGDTFRIKSKKATLVNSDDQFPSLALWF